MGRVGRSYSQSQSLGMDHMFMLHTPGSLGLMPKRDNQEKTRGETFLLINQLIPKEGLQPLYRLQSYNPNSGNNSNQNLLLNRIRSTY